MTTGATPNQQVVPPKDAPARPAAAGPAGPAPVTPETPPLVSGSILWNLFLFAAWVLVMTTLAFHGALGTVVWFAAADPDFINLPSWFVWTWLYLAALPAAIAAIVWGRQHRNDKALIASMVLPAIPVAIALLGFAQA